MSKAIVISDMPFLRVRGGAGTDKTVVGYFKNGAAIDVNVDGAQNDAKGKPWYPVEVVAIASGAYADEALSEPAQFKVTGWGWVIASLVKVDGAPPEPHPPVVFTVTPASITAGDKVTLSWSVKDIVGIWLDGAAEAGVMTRERYPTKDTTYTLKVEYRDGTTEEFKRSIAVKPAPVVASKPILGVNNIKSGDYGRAALGAGVQAISTTFNPQWAGEIKQAYPHVKVAVRGLLYGGYTPTIDEWWSKIWQGAVDGNYMIGLNENDHGVGTSPADIRARIAFDKAALARTKYEAAKRGITLYYCGGGFSVGEPNVLNDDVAIAMSGYAELLEDPCFRFNQHLYATDDHGPDITREKIRDLIFDESYGDMPSRRYQKDANGKWGWVDTVIRVYRVDWTIRRYALNIQRCGWNPEASNKIVSDECGLDIGSRGGFMGMEGCDDAFMMRWARQFIKVQSWPVLVAGKAYPSPLEWALLFQTGDMDRWASYDIRTKLPALMACGWGQN